MGIRLIDIQSSSTALNFWHIRFKWICKSVNQNYHKLYDSNESIYLVQKNETYFKQIIIYKLLKKICHFRLRFEYLELS